MSEQVYIPGLLPHRSPVLLVDRVDELVPGQRCVAVKAVSLNEPYFAGLPAAPGPEPVEFPPVLLLESWVQAAGILLSAGADTDRPSVMLLGSVNGVEFGRPVVAGDLVEHHAAVVRTVGDTAIVAGSSRVGADEVLVVGQAVVALRPPELVGAR